VYTIQLVNKLNIEKKKLSHKEFQTLLNKVDIYGDLTENIEILKAYGMPLVSSGGSVYLETAKRSYKEEVFCIVDIETTGPSTKSATVIEIGAIKYQNGTIIDRYESFIYAAEVPPIIEELTGITTEDLVNAPKLPTVMAEFRLFLADAVFVAHNASFDYSFLSAMMRQCDLGPLLNRYLCTIDLAHRTIEAQKYGLRYLSEHLGLDASNHHRAYSDAFNTVKILEVCLENLPQTVVTTEDLLKFSKSAKKLFYKAPGEDS
jgi:DNA polymerase-3 subunit epsilon